MQSGNLFDAIPLVLPTEITECLLSSAVVRIERILSQGHHSAPGFWYDQPQNEWVLLLQGAAVLRFEQDNQTVQLRPGTYLNIAAHQRHRLESSSAQETTVWLAVFY